METKQVCLIPKHEPQHERGKNWSIIELTRETETDYYGKPLSNPACPVIQFPKYAWKEL